MTYGHVALPRASCQQSLELFLHVFFFTRFCGIQLLVATILSHRYNSRMGSGETKVESHASSDTQPNQAALLLNTARIQPGSQPHQFVRGNTVHLATLVSVHCARPATMRDETRISLPAKPSLTRMTLGQLCVAPRTSQLRPVTTEPGREPRVSGGTAGAAVQRP